MKCYDCGGTLKDECATLHMEDECVGSFMVVDVSHKHCDSCGNRLYPPESARKIEEARSRRLEDLLKSLAVSGFLSAAETARILGISRQALHKHRQIRRGFIYQTEFAERVVYLRKSVELFKETGDGRFPLAPHETPIQYEETRESQRPVVIYVQQTQTDVAATGSLYSARRGTIPQRMRLHGN